MVLLERLQNLNLKIQAVIVVLKKSDHELSTEKILALLKEIDGALWITRNPWSEQ